MNTSKMLLLGVAAAVTLTANQNLGAADNTSQVAGVSQNRALATSPRMLEQFPWLARQTAARAESTPRSESALSAIKKNHALAASPRMLEQFPELARAGQSVPAASARSIPGPGQLASVMNNRALAQSPRMREQFPQLARGYTSQPAIESLEVAPLK